MISLKCFARLARMLLTGWLFAASWGCNSVQRAAERMASLARSEPSAEADEDSVADPPLDQPGSVRPSRQETTPDGPAAVALDAQVQSALASAAWVATVPRSDGTPPPDRWRHPLLEALPPEKHLSDLRAALASDKPLVAANARVALAHYANKSSAESLAKIVRERSHPLPVRLAAAESLGKSTDVKAADALRGVLDDLASREQFAKPQYVPELHAELLYALAARCTPPYSGSERTTLEETDADYCVAALASPAANVRLAAVRAWLSAGRAPLPAEMLDRRADSDPRVRGVVLETIGKWPPEQARDYLTAALNDHDLTVRLSAIRSLGHLADDGSLKALKRLLQHDAELVRAAAVSALVERGEIDTLLEAADDSAWHVRAAAARLLAEHRHERTDTLAAKLLVDASPHVQQQMVASLAHWPLEQAGPLLLSAMGSSGFLVRKSARDELVKRWPAAEEFSTDAPADSRTVRLAALRRRWQAEFGSVSQVAAAKPQAADARPADTAPEVPKIAGLLNELQASDLDVRRRAADRLAQQTVKAPLSAAAAETLCRSVIADPDALVQRGALAALAGNTGEAATRLVYAGLSHPAAEVRRRACEHLQQHPDPRHHDVLIKSLEDADSEVIRTALHALAKSGAKVDPAPVKRLLTVTDKTLRVDAAECLVQLGAAGGDAALERLALDPDPAIRRQAAAAMGRSGDAALLPALMRLLDDQGGVRQTALASLAQIAGKDVARVDQAEPPPNSIEEVRRWRDWYQTRK